MKRSLLIFLSILALPLLQAQSLYVGQYNIRNKNAADAENGNGWEQRLPVICNILNYEQFDIFGAQEVFYSQLNDILSGLGGYAYVGVGRDDGAQKGEYAPIFYRTSKIKCLDSGTFWLSENPEKIGVKGWDAKYPRICTWGKFEDRKSGKVFWMFNLHMDHRGIEARRESARLVLGRISEMCGGYPYILTGDFNVDQRNEIYGILTESGSLRDTFEEAERRISEVGTTNHFNTNEWTDSRIDHIFVSSQFNVNDYGIFTYAYWSPDLRFPSDHHPVGSHISIPVSMKDKDWAQYGYYEAQNREAGDVDVVFLGNSITRNWLRYYPEFFEKNPGYVCRGISGQVSAQMLARFRSDVINLNPKVVVIMAGTNDIAMNQGYISVEHTFENIVSMTELARYNGINVILCSVLPAEIYPWRKEISSEEAVSKTLELNEKLKSYAKVNKIQYADYYSVMNDGKGGLAKEYQRDAVHPDHNGYVVMEDVIQKILAKILKRIK